MWDAEQKIFHKGLCVQAKDKCYFYQILIHEHLCIREGPRGIDPRKSPGFPRPRGDGAGTGIGLQNLRGQGGDGEH